jgi:hypothetical protein
VIGDLVVGGRGPQQAVERLSGSPGHLASAEADRAAAARRRSTGRPSGRQPGR